MYERVIIPTDGSRCAMKGVVEGLDMAKDLGIEAVAVYVIDRGEYEGLHHESIKRSAMRGFKKRGRDALRSVKEAADKRGVDLKTKVLEGVPYKEINGVAERNDIIYISTHGFSGFSHLFLGSTTERVLKNTKSTVAVVRGR